ncbi:MAG: RNA polymerase sigma factor [Firmicutes bacterium]|jgi:RNA polymerase sigma-70 factor (ECF subfamily)|nr:RNA polymerase sigma factor [Bacillota bacterium]
MNPINALLLQIKKGKRQAMQDLYEQTRRGVFAFILPYLKDTQLTEDVMQDTYLKVMDNIQQYQVTTNGMNWILTIARNTALNLIKVRDRETQVERETLEATLPSSRDIYDLGSPVITLAKKILDQDEQKILFLYAISEYKHREIALIMDIPIGTVTWKYNQAIKKMKGALKK